MLIINFWRQTFAPVSTAHLAMTLAFQFDSPVASIGLINVICFESEPNRNSYVRMTLIRCQKENSKENKKVVRRNQRAGITSSVERQQQKQTVLALTSIWHGQTCWRRNKNLCKILIKLNLWGYNVVVVAQYFVGSGSNRSSFVEKRPTWLAGIRVGSIC